MSTILHVEDESAVRLLYEEVFEEQGHEMLQVATAEEALATLRSGASPRTPKGRMIVARQLGAGKGRRKNTYCVQSGRLNACLQGQVSNLPLHGLP